MSTQLHTATLHVHTCITCGVLFGMPEELHERRRAYREDFYCPNGHCSVYRESEADKLKKQLARKQQILDAERADLRRERERHDHTKDCLRAQKGVATKLRKRVAAGVCPCCNRTFKQLARHMKTQHPEYAA